jgi:hypothetical protein
LSFDFEQILVLYLSSEYFFLGFLNLFSAENGNHKPKTLCLYEDLHHKTQWVEMRGDYFEESDD